MLDAQIDANGQSMVSQGRNIFRNDTFGDEDFWTNTVKLHQALEGAANGGVGPGVSPATALAVGLKVDSEALPNSVIQAIQQGKVDLNDPKTTLALLSLNAVIGVKATMNSDGSIKTFGITCALCHSTVDDSFAPGIGHRRDGWPNRDLNVGAIINLSPDLSAVDSVLGVSDATTRAVLQSWGPGRFDAELFMDGKAFRPDGKTAATLIPPAFGLAATNLHTYTGWGSVTYWNAFVAVLEMHGKGNFTDARLDNPIKFPVAARNHFGHVSRSEDDDQVTAKLGPLHIYQLAIPAPKPPAGSFDEAAADRGDKLFSGKAKCASCHTEPLTTEPGWNMHTPAEIGIDSFQADRAPDGMYRTTPLHGIFAHSKGGFYHDGRFATLLDVVNHYNSVMNLGLTEAEKSDVVE
ncbi:MAG TPA: hypothetical protein VF980_00330, partial [Thermoanaerobaculia bacterium]